MDTQVERLNCAAVRKYIIYLAISYHILGINQSSLIAREYTVKSSCDCAHDVQMVIGAGSGVTVDTGVENRDTQ